MSSEDEWIIRPEDCEVPDPAGPKKRLREAQKPRSVDGVSLLEALLAPPPSKNNDGDNGGFDDEDQSEASPTIKSLLRLSSMMSHSSRDRVVLAEMRKALMRQEELQEQSDTGSGPRVNMVRQYSSIKSQMKDRCLHSFYRLKRNEGELNWEFRKCPDTPFQKRVGPNQWEDWSPPPQ